MEKASKSEVNINLKDTIKMEQELMEHSPGRQRTATINILDSLTQKINSTAKVVLDLFRHSYRTKWNIQRIFFRGIKAWARIISSKEWSQVYW